MASCQASETSMEESFSGSAGYLLYQSILRAPGQSTPPVICSISPSITTPLFHVPAPLMDDVPKYHLSPVVHLCFIQFCHKYKVFHQVEIGCPFFHCPAIAPLRRLIIQKNCKRFELANCWDVWSYSYNFFWVNEIPLIGILFNDSEWTNLFFD